jgi:hypothetical protein
MTRLVHAAVAAVSIAGLLSGCASNTTVETVPVNTVLDALKSDIASIQPTVQLPPDPANACADPDHVVRIEAYPTKAVVQLKTVITAVIDANGSANIPAGPSGIIVSPSLGASKSNIHTQDVTYTLPIQHNPPTRADLQTEITTLNKYITDRTKVLTDLRKASDADGRRAAQDVSDKLNAAKDQLRKDELALAGVEASPGNQTPWRPHTFDLPLPRQPLLHADMVATLPGEATTEPAKPTEIRKAPAQGHVDFELGIAQAFNHEIAGLLSTSHARPCFLPQQMDIKVSFEAIKKVDAGLTITFLVAKIGGDASRQDDTTQTVTLTFDLSGGNATSSGGPPAGG